MKSTKLVCLGDSLTEGYGISQSARWSDLLQKDLDIEIINQGISGDTTNGMLSRFHNDVIAENATHVLITGGTNDLAWNLPDKLILSNYSSMLRHSTRAGIKVIFGIPTPVLFQKNDERALELYVNLQTLGERIEGLRRKLKLFAGHKELPVIDFFKNITSEHFLADGVHPDEAGNLVMKESAKEILEKILNE